MMRISKFLLTGFLIAITLQIFGQGFSIELPIAKRIFIQSAVNYGYDNGGYWSCSNSSSKPLLQLHEIDSCMDCSFILKESSDKGYYEIFPENANEVKLSFFEAGNSADQFSFYHICDGLFKIYNRNGGVICWEKDANLGICADSNSAEVCWYLIDADTNKPLKYEDDTIIVKRPNRKKSEFYAQIRANYYQYGTKVPLFFERLSFLDLRCKEFGEIVLALNDCISTMDQTERTILVLKGMSKNPDVSARKYVYTEIEKVNFRKPNFISKATIEKYFAEREQETNPELSKIIQRINRKMLAGFSFLTK